MEKGNEYIYIYITHLVAQTIVLAHIATTHG